MITNIIHILTFYLITLEFKVLFNNFSVGVPVILYSRTLHENNVLTAL